MTRKVLTAKQDYTRERIKRHIKTAYDALPFLVACGIALMVSRAWWMHG